MASATRRLWGLLRRPGGWYRAQLHTLEVTAGKVAWLRARRPCVLQVNGRRFTVFEVLHRPWFGRDRLGRKRLAFCGAVIANLEAGIRGLGWTTKTEIPERPVAPDLVGLVSAVDRCAPKPPARAHTSRLQNAFRRDPNPAVPLTPAQLEAALAAAMHDGVSLYPVPSQDGTTTLAVVTPCDGRQGAVLAGLVTQRLWLHAAAHGYRASVDAKLLCRSAKRAELRAALHTAGVPQLLIRLGAVTEQVSARQSTGTRVPTGQVLRGWWAAEPAS